MSHNDLKLGTWNFVCDLCGRKLKASEARRTWDGFIVCPDDYDPKHEQIEVRGIKDDQSVPWTRPDDGIRLTDTGQINKNKPENYFIDVIQTGENSVVSSGQLVDINADFVSAGVQVNDVVRAYELGRSYKETTVTNVVDLQTLDLADNIFTSADTAYSIRRPSNQVTGDDL